MKNKKQICVFCGEEEIDLIKEANGVMTFFCGECKQYFDLEKRVKK